MTNPKMLSIGDVVVDDFIKLKHAEINCDVDNCKICIEWGQKLPFESSTIVPAVGNSANASVCFARLGLDSSFLSFTGKDDKGKLCIDTLQKEGVDTKYMQMQEGKQTNYHYILSYDAERTILVNHESFDYSMDKIDNAPDFIYLSSVAENAVDFHKEIVEFAKKNNSKIAFQPGTFQIKLGIEKLDYVYQNSELFFCNKEEAQTVLKTKESDIKTLLLAIKDLGVKIPVITDGVKGAYVLDGESMISTTKYPDIAPPVERTGAGDAFSSAFSAFYMMGMSLEDCLKRSPINSMSVVQHIGAQKGLLTQEQIEDFLEKAPPEYTPVRN